MEAHAAAEEKPFCAAEEQFASLVVALRADEQMGMTHDALESFVQQRGTEVLRLLLQGHLDLRRHRVSTGPVVGADGVERAHRALHGGEEAPSHLSAGPKNSEQVTRSCTETRMPA
jgi:hypothetical protein